MRKPKIGDIVLFKRHEQPASPAIIVANHCGGSFFKDQCYLFVIERYGTFHFLAEYSETIQDGHWTWQEDKEK